MKSLVMQSASDKRRKSPQYYYIALYALLLGLIFTLLLPSLGLADESLALPEDRSAADMIGDEHATITAFRIPADDVYSSKTVATPIDLPAGSIVQSVWFVVQVLCYDEDTQDICPDGTPDDTDAAMLAAIYRVGLSTYDHLITSPVEGDLANSGPVGYDPARFPANIVSKVSVEPLLDAGQNVVERFYKVGVELDQPYQAATAQTVWAWTNMEYPNKGHIIELYQFGNAAGNDVLVNQVNEVFPRTYTSMLWVEQAGSFDYPPQYNVNFFGTKKKAPAPSDSFVANKVFTKKEFGINITAAGGDFANKQLDIRLKVANKDCENVLATVTTNELGEAVITGTGPGSPRKSQKLEISVVRAGEAVGTATGKLLYVGRKVLKTGKLPMKKIQKICNGFQLDQ